MSESPDKVNLSMSHRIVAASVGGIMTALIMTPLDVIKIRMQSQGITATNKCFLYCNGLMDHLCTCPAGANFIPWYKRPGKFVGTWDALHKIVRNEGIWSLWSGLSPTLVMALPQTVIYYTLNDWLKELVGYPHAQRSRAVGTHLNLSSTDWIPGLVGGVSRVCAVAVISPLELLRTKMQSYSMTPEHLIRTLKDAVSQSGLQSLWTGMGPTLLRDVPYSMICWLVFDYLKSRYLIGQLSDVHFNVSESVKLPVLPYGYAFLFGATAGLCAGVLTHPFDVIKTRRQVELGETLVHGRTYSKSTWISLRQLYSSSGPRAMFVGFTPRLMKTTCASAIMIATFETSKYHFAGSLSAPPS
ncbi:hypothetical protein CRM22_009458 [Opisthorchis felineus]|uniref:Solute carrier family 25 member 40 n=1 Tax=Opisthorchis felineus TaxID=147828 RepID=A0A4S2LEJ0_OPIFE|nr:hypothetical protein CRM22_009458 [Opisthorchis felineus]